jgi:opacity protein-like surface antigen
MRHTPWLLLGAITLAAAPAQAQDSGFYIGAFAGGAFLNSNLVTPSFTQTQTVSTTVRINTPFGIQNVAVTAPVSTTIPSQRLRNQGGQGFVGGLRMGYGWRLAERFYLGAEGEVSFPQNAQSRLSIMGISYRARLETEGAVFLRAGYTFSNTSMVYLRGGVAIPRQVARVGRQSVERWAPTPAFGLGFEQRVTPRVSLRADMTYMPAMENNQIGSFRAVLGLSYHF